MTTLDSASFHRLRVLFESAQSLSFGEREALLDAECEGDPHLRASVEAMLAADEDPAFLKRPEDLSLERPRELQVPDRIDRFEVLDLLGEGGSSVVVRARQLAPIRRTVALKVLRAARIDARARTRFQMEGELLAGLTHSGIAQIHDAGESSDGQLFLAMELVEGAPITAWCDTNARSIEERLRLFLRVVEAVQYAHQNGVVHRDIKADNVLVKDEGEGPVVKLIDFGIAKSIAGGGPRSLRSTWDGAILGTPATMSPEQASGGAIDTRTDVHGLGVLMFELLTGTLPHDPESLSARPVDEVLRTIREVEPRSLLDAVRAMRGGLASSARLRSTSPTALARALRGDVSWICSRALATDPARRYPTAAALGDDVERFLSNAAIVARPSHPGYLARRFVSRHRFGVTVAVGIGLATIATILALAWTLDTVRRARDDARSREGEAAEQREVAVRREYAARIAAAGAALESGDTARARSHLDLAPPERRGWEWRHIASQLDGSASLSEFDSFVIGAQWVGPDRLLVLLKGRGVVIDVRTGNEVAELDVGSDELDQVITGPGPDLLLVDRRHRIDLVETESLEAVRTVFSIDSDVRSMCLAPGGRWLMTTENSGSVRMHDIEGEEPARVLFELERVARSPAFVQGGSRILLGCADGVLELRDRESGERLEAWTYGVEEIKAMVVARDERTAIIGIGTRVLRVDLASGLVVASCDADVEVRDLELSPDGRALYVSGGWTRGRLLRVNASTLELEERLLGHTAGVQCIACPPAAVTTESGDIVLASGDGDGQVRFWRRDERRTVRSFVAGYGATGLCSSPGGERVITTDSIGRALIWDVATLDVVDELDFGEGIYASAMAGTDLIAGGTKLHVVSLESGARATGPLLSGVVTELATSPCNRWLAGTARLHDRVFLWSLPGLAPVWEGSSKTPTDVLYDPRSERFVILSTETIAQSLDPGRPTLEPYVGPHAAAASAARTGEASGRAYITVGNSLYLTTSSEVAFRSAVEGFASSVVLLEDGDRVFVGGNDDLLRVLDRDGRELLVLDDAPKPISRLTIGAGERVFGLSQFPGSPSYLVVWDAPSGASTP